MKSKLIKQNTQGLWYHFRLGLYEGLFGKPKIDGEELRKCLAYFEEETKVAAFQEREGDLFNNTLARCLNSVFENPQAPYEIWNAADRLVQAAHESIRRNEAIQPIPDRVLESRVAWCIVLVSFNDWAEASLAAWEGLANGRTPDHAYIQRLLERHQVACCRWGEEQKRFLGQLGLTGDELVRVLHALIEAGRNAAATADNWQPVDSPCTVALDASTPSGVRPDIREG